MKYLIITIIALFIVSGCTIRVYNDHIPPVEIDSSIGWNGKVKVKTFQGKIFIFDSITKGPDNYIGYIKKNNQLLKIDLAAVDEINLENKKKSRIAGSSVNIILILSLYLLYIQSG